MNKTKSLLTIIGSIIILGTTLVSSLKKEEEIVEKPEKSKTTETVYNETKKVELFLQDGEKREEDIKIQVGVDNSEDKIYFELQTQNFNNTKWKEEAIQRNSFTRINEGWSRVYLVHPKNVNISQVNQLGYAVPLHKWIKLIPVEECKECQIEQREGKKIITEASGLIIPIPGIDKLVGKFIDYQRNKKDSIQNELEKIVGEEMVVTNIPSNIQQNISSTLTARTYEIEMDTAQISEGEVIPIRLWTRTALGDPSIASGGMPPNRYGISEIVIPFEMVGKKGVSKDEMEVYTKKIGDQTDIFIKINGEEKRLTETSQDETYPLLSPNKKRIAFSLVDEDKINWIYVMNVDGTGLKRIDHTGRTVREPKWSTDSNGVIFMKERSMVEHNGWGKINVYTYFEYDIIKGGRKMVGGNDWDLDTRQVIPYNETPEQRIIRRREWIENERKHGRKVRIKENE